MSDIALIGIRAPATPEKLLANTVQHRASVPGIGPRLANADDGNGQDSGGRLRPGRKAAADCIDRRQDNTSWIDVRSPALRSCGE
jgi:hypothetical protein